MELVVGGWGEHCSPSISLPSIPDSQYAVQYHTAHRKNRNN